MTDTGLSKYGELSREQLIALLEKRDRTKKLGLVWERHEIEVDATLASEFVAADLVTPLSDPQNRSSGWPNLVIEGDNFDALRWLRMTMRGRVKCIYIDPPYNTGAKDWVYNDHYIKKEDRWRHSTWLEFLYRRLDLARDLLTSDGVLLVSINDENRARLELLLDEVMPGMRKGSLVWRTRVGGNEGGEAFLSDNHEHILVYGASDFRFGGTEKSLEMYKYTDANGEKYRISDMTVAVAYNDKRAGQAYYPLRDPTSDIYYPANPDRVWSYASRERSGASARIKTKFIEDWVADGRVAFPENPKTVRYETREALIAAVRAGEAPPFIREDLPEFDAWVGRTIGFGSPGFKRYIKDLKSATQPLSSWITPRSEKDTIGDDENAILAGTTDEGAKTIKAIFGEKAFNYAKPPSLIKGLLAQCTGPGDVILDFFAGSATTAQAVMELNAEDQGSRRFVMVSSTERTEQVPTRNIAEQVTAERIRRLNAADDKTLKPLYAPFAYLRLATMRYEDIDYDFSDAQAWTALEVLHELPTTPWRGDAWQMHEEGDEILVMVRSPSPALFEAIAAHTALRHNVFVYSWAPGGLAASWEGVDLELRSIGETLLANYRR
ncbi:site-specific DNA-methyltransferase [Sphingobium chlorophenolicum]|nr:site-specific DNA-methyltransferase [Sphingobium chlorophenolicum]